MTTRDEAIDIRVDDQRIAGTLVTPDTLIPGVLFVHGWGGSQETYLARGRTSLRWLTLVEAARRQAGNTMVR
jgi:fermentation-respiration switch protein FrsA (DUF1100 family)